MLRKVSAARIQILHMPIHLDPRANPVAIRFRAPQPKYDAALRHAAVITQNPDLRREPALQNNIEIPVIIDIRCGESSRVVGEIQSADAGKIVKLTSLSFLLLSTL